jgi:1-acyl-sn-glycerol-3-phosphate acyltransferase
VTDQPGVAPPPPLSPSSAQAHLSAAGFLRAFLNSSMVAVATLVGAVAALVSRVFDRSGDSVLWLARRWARLIGRLAGLEMVLEARATLDPSRPYVFMANHLSTVDIWATLAVLPVPVRMIAKKQLAAIPLLGWAMWAGRFIFIDRQNPAAARRSIERAKDRIRNGHSVLLFPEGTRSRQGSLLPFKKGGFHLAIDAGVPIVPLALRGSREAMPPGSLLLRPGRVRVVMGEPVATAGLAERDRDALMVRVRAEIERMLAG